VACLITQLIHKISVADGRYSIRADFNSFEERIASQAADVSAAENERKYYILRRLLIFCELTGLRL
jgi:hypothetical protein